MARPTAWLIVPILAIAFLALACAPSASPSQPPQPGGSQSSQAAGAGGSPGAAAASGSTAPAAGASGAPAGAAAFATVPPTPRVTIRAGGLGGAIDRGYFVGVDKGFYEEQGLDLDVQTFRSAADMVPLLATGRMDVGHGSTNPGFYNALASGIPVKIVTDVTLMRAPEPGIHNSMSLIVRKDLVDSGQVRGVADLRGRKVAINGTGNLNHLQLKEVLAYNGLTLGDVDVTQVPFPDQMSALGNGAIDAGITVDPFITLAEARGIAVPIFDVGQAMPGRPAQQLFYGPEFIQTQPDVGKRFIVGYLKALRYLEDAFTKGINREEAIQLFIDNTPLKDRALYDQMGFSYSETNGNVNLQALDKDQDFYLQQGMQKEKIAPELLVDPTFAQYAVQVLGPYQP
ncbi:MAG TPA: ABC transporter substrate-binding protein [Chloroflexota bacterium]|nr:ABC transporter substrate-binding protein [Chloroflexota bacterium]